MGDYFEKAYSLNNVVMAGQAGLKHARLEVYLRLGVQFSKAL